MTYSTPDKLREITRKLPTSITDQDIQTHIDKAEAYINGSLGGVFSVPFLPVPKLIETITTDMSLFFLAESLYSSSQPNLDEYEKTRYDRSIEMLEKIALGDILLIVDGEIVYPKGGTLQGFATTNDQQVFNYEEPWW